MRSAADGHANDEDKGQGIHTEYSSTQNILRKIHKQVPPGCGYSDIGKPIWQRVRQRIVDFSVQCEIQQRGADVNGNGQEIQQAKNLHHLSECHLSFSLGCWNYEIRNSASHVVANLQQQLLVQFGDQLRQAYVQEA